MIRILLFAVYIGPPDFLSEVSGVRIVGLHSTCCLGVGLVEHKFKPSEAH